MLPTSEEKRLDAEILSSVSRPARYIGGEWNAVRKPWNAVQVRFALAFPDVYDVGMAHLGLPILYDILNRRGDALAERVYAPWPDMEAAMREKGVPLLSVESGTPVRRFDVIGFTLQYELSYTNVLNMLDLAGVPLRSADRSASDPLVIAGGPCAFNPEPLAPFVDFFLVGDGEEAIDEIAGMLVGWLARGGRSRHELFEAAARIQGVYAPSLYKPVVGDRGEFRGMETAFSWVPARVQKRVVRDLDSASFPERFIVPFVEVVHDRATVELLRGCTRGCRFCQAGMIYRPVRERTPETLRRQIDAVLRATGYEEIGLSSLSSTDYTGLPELLSGLVEDLGSCGVSLSVPSLRADSFSIQVAEDIQRLRRTGLTFAPEAGTARLRAAINKTLAEEDLLGAVRAAFQAGWHSVKLYFMVGLPTETAEDVEAIAALARKLLREARNARFVQRAPGGRSTSAGSRKPVRLGLSVASFVPKSHTPFQWDAQDSIPVLEEKLKVVRKLAGVKGLELSWHDPRLSFLEAVFARGDRRVAEVLERAWRLGCRFDGWADQFKFDPWLQAFRECGVDPAWYANRVRPLDEVMPWDHIDSGLSRRFLVLERARAEQGEETPDCRSDDCPGCGVCPRLDVDNQMAKTAGRGARQ